MRDVKSGLSILMHGVISLSDGTSYDNQFSIILSFYDQMKFILWFDSVTARCGSLCW